MTGIHYGAHLQNILKACSLRQAGLAESQLVCEEPLVHKGLGMATLASLLEGATADSTLKLDKGCVIHGVLRATKLPAEVMLRPMGFSALQATRICLKSVQLLKAYCALRTSLGPPTLMSARAL